MRFLTMFCGYSNAESDSVRRGIAKKRGTEQFIEEIHDRFIEYSHNKYNMPVDKLEEIFPPIKQGILDASSYAFSWNHSDAYSCIGYISGYLRYYYPLEFLTAAFNIFTDKIEKIASITQYANKHNIVVKDQKFRHSRSGYMLDKEQNAIYKGLKSIKYMNEQVAEDLYALRNNCYPTFFDFLDDYTGDARQLEILIKLNFFSEFGRSQKLLRLVELYNMYNSMKVLKKTDSNVEIVEIARKYCDKETEKQLRFTNGVPKKFLVELSEYIPDKDIPLGTLLEAQKEYLGYITFKDSSLNENLWIVTDITFYKGSENKPYLTVYRLKTGESLKMKIKRSNLFVEQPFRQYSIMRLDESNFREAYKMKMDETTGKAVKTDVITLILDSYEVLKL